MNRIFLIFLALLLSPVFGFAQTYKDYKKEADMAFANKDYKKAAEMYFKAVDMIKNSKPKSKHMDLFYNFGRSEMLIANYKKAVELFDVFLDLSLDNFRKVKDRRKVKEWKEWCEIKLYAIPSAHIVPDHGDTLLVENLQLVNSGYNDYSPFYDEKEQTLFFTTRRNTARGAKKRVEYGDDIFYAKHGSEGFVKSKKLSGRINTTKQDMSPFLFEDKMYYGISEYVDFVLEEPEKGNINVAEQKDNQWKKSKELDIINSEAWDGAPSISPDGNYMYFVSERPGGFGGKDIFYSKKDPATGTWGVPINAGKNINTKFDENSPRVSPSGKILYFSSKGYVGFGGYDILFSEIGENNELSKPKNLGAPINTNKDEIYYILHVGKTKRAFWASNKGVKKDFDIYMIELSDLQSIDIETFRKLEPEKVEEKDESEQEMVAEKILTEEEKELIEKQLSLPDYEIEKLIQNIRVEDLKFRVQIGAFVNRKTDLTVFKGLDKYEIIEEVASNYVAKDQAMVKKIIYKYLINNEFETIKEARDFQKTLPKQYYDNWPMGYYKGKRILLINARRLLLENKYLKE